MKSGKIISVVVALIAGVVIGHSFQSTPAIPPSASETAGEHDEAIRKLQDLTENDIADYYRLKTMEERYVKAEELLGKMMTIFLADLGMKLSGSAQAAIENPAVVQSSPNTLTEGASSASTVSAMGSEKQIITKGIGSEANIGPAPGRRSIDEVRSDREIEKFLKDSRSSNLDDVVKTSRGLTNRAAIEALQGTFVGSGPVRDKGENVTWDFEFTFNGRLEDDTLKGTHHIRISKAGSVFSNSKGNGNLSNDYREVPSDPAAILVEAGPSTILQMYYVKQADAVIGNVYRKLNSAESYKVIGSFKLNR